MFARTKKGILLHFNILIMIKKKNELPPNTVYEVKNRYSRGKKPNINTMTKSMFDYWSKNTQNQIIEVQILINFSD